MADEEMDDFDTAFAELVAAADKGEVTPPADETPPASETPPATPPETPPATPPAGETPPATPPETPPAETPPVAPPVAAAPPATPVSAPPAAPPAPPPAPAAPVETPEQKTAREAFEASIKPYEPSEEEKAALAKMKVDFPGEYVAIEARLKSVDRDINARVYAAVKDVMQQMDGRLTPVEQTVNTTSLESHKAAIHAAHADFDAVVPKVAEWIKTQPAYLQPALQAVYDQGTTEDVIALVSDYKKAAGITAAPPTPTPKPAPAAPADAADLAPVGTKRAITGPKGAPDKLDYDGAWNDLAAAR